MAAKAKSLQLTIYSDDCLTAWCKAKSFIWQGRKIYIIREIAINMTTKIVKARPIMRITPFLWIVGIAILFAYGLLAMNAGFKLSDTYTNVHADKIAIMMRDRADRNEAVDHKTAMETLPLWVNISAQFGTDRFVYGSDGPMDAFIHYFQMNRFDKFILSAHMMLGTVIMICGSLQFLPFFRKKYPRFHRYSGSTYMLAAFTSMIFSMYHLVETGPDKTFGGFAFYVGLWFLAICSTGAMIAAFYYIKKKDIMRHMGWQAMAFGFFLTAPLQRVNWMVLPYFFSAHTSFNEMNYLINVVLLIEASLVGFLLFYVNRLSINSNVNMVLASPKDMRKTAKSSIASIMASFAVVTGGLFIYYYVVSPGFENHATTSSLFPPALIAADLAIHINRAYDIIFSLLGCFSVATIAFWFAKPLAFVKRPVILCLCGASLAMAVILWKWALMIGLPSHSVSAGGTFFALTGSLIILFSLLSLWAFHGRRYYLLDEFLLFLFAAVIAPPMAYISAFIVDTIALVPERFIATGHGYQIAMIGAILPGLLVVNIYSIYAVPLARKRILI